jgi:hypothetical protein
MKHIDKILISLVAIFIGIGVSLNLYEQYSVDKTKLPLKLETHSRFQRWLSNLKDKGLDLEADKFRFLEDNNIFNSIWTSTESIDNELSRKNYELNMSQLLELKESVLSPNEREVVNFTQSDRFGYQPNEVFFYGLREDRILRTKIADCPSPSNCNFHRAAFIDNHVFFVMELSQKNFDKNNPKICLPDEVCEYTFKVHLVDLNNNSRSVYESETVNDTYLNLDKKL